ncbi:HAD family hydrolase [Methanolobus bombayensis]|uniref:HAD family hydrolase n=1 Tax=Methanolobus bombayensis TaxID=38023 RepID=UPI001FD73494|nr:HAD family hydrolase [Methanolobus bombayensis]MBP1909401.1 putative hydrolase of the HAD superfamily [Methanolobus bombayensis]
MNLRGIIFDMDNTLFDFVEAKIVACTEVVSFLGAGDPGELFEYFRRETHGFENPENIKDYLFDNGLDPIQNYQRCVTIYETHKIDHIRLYPDVRETLEELNEIGLPLGIVTDANSNNARKRLEKTGLEKLVQSLTAHDMTGAKKPDHAPFKYALESMKLNASETLFVGDSLRRDIAPSKELGMMTAYAAYGDRNSAKDRTSGEYKPDRTLNNFREVLEIVRELK